MYEHIHARDHFRNTQTLSHRNTLFACMYVYTHINTYIHIYVCIVYI